MKKICSLLVLCATVVFASCSKDDPVTEPVPEGITVTTYDALLDALQTGGTSADAPTLVTLGADITIPAGGDYNTPPMNGSGYFKIDGRRPHPHLGRGKRQQPPLPRQFRPRRRCRLYRTHQYQSGPTGYGHRGSCLQRQDYAGQRRGIERAI